MQTRTVCLSLLLVAVLGSVTACGHGASTASKETDGNAKGNEQTKDSGTLTVALGHRAKSPDGTTATVSDFTRGVTSEYASVKPQPFVAFKVTVHNGASEIMDLTRFSLSCADGEPVYDSTQGLEAAGSATWGAKSYVDPGEDATWKDGCPLPKDAHKVQIKVTPEAIKYQTAIFSGEVK
ncbi:hypothetical protein [Streptomyces sp. bgisy159]|uniref:hypothetical protein n=1 Tax=Streptomyces sp. bgisy159 TaxID=3413795 RepID=UPI003F4A10FD